MCSALVGHPEVVLLDNPLNGLSADHRANVIKVISQLKGKCMFAVIMLLLFPADTTVPHAVVFSFSQIARWLSRLTRWMSAAVWALVKRHSWLKGSFWRWRSPSSFQSCAGVISCHSDSNPKSVSERRFPSFFPRLEISVNRANFSANRAGFRSSMVQTETPAGSSRNSR